jgi:L-ascorbate metabolism protein UlaG (beta-lactamase superfamily)
LAVHRSVSVNREEIMDIVDKIHWLGQAAFCIESEEAVIYIDPYQLKRDEPKADIILISHGHFDHCSAQDIEKIHKPQTLIIGPPGIKNALSYPARVIKPGDKTVVGKIEIEAVAAYNVKKSFHPKSSGNLGFIIQINQIRIYHAGDTDLIPEMDTIKANIVLLPVGGTYTMNAQEAAEAINKIKPDVAVPMHWGSVVGSRRDAEDFKKFCECRVEIKEPG